MKKIDQKLIYYTNPVQAHTNTRITFTLPCETITAIKRLSNGQFISAISMSAELVRRV